MYRTQETTFGEVPTRDGLATLRDALRSSGGVAQADDLARLLEDYRLGEFAGLAGLIDQHCVFAFECQRSLWIPMFQFDLYDLSLTSGVVPVVGNLSEVFDGWKMAKWFAWPNRSLGDWRPVDVLREAPAKVLSAAQAERASSGATRRVMHAV